jgi:hypothetical protein
MGCTRLKHCRYPAFDPRVDLEFPGGVKRIMWGYQKTVTNGTGPVDNVASPNIACRFGPLIPPALTAVARAGSNISFEWTAWFENHKGPVLTVRHDSSSDVEERNSFR